MVLNKEIGTAPHRRQVQWQICRTKIATNTPAVKRSTTLSERETWPPVNKYLVFMQIIKRKKTSTPKKQHKNPEKQHAFYKNQQAANGKQHSFLKKQVAFNVHPVDFWQMQHDAL